MNTTGKLAVISNHLELAPIIRMDQSFFPNPWNDSQWKELNMDHYLILSWSGPELEAFALLGLVPGDDTAHLYKIQVDPKKQGTGVSIMFWTAVVEHLRQRRLNSIYLEVESTNERAIRFYKKVGFTCLRRVKNYYSNGSDGLMLLLTL